MRLTSFTDYSLRVLIYVATRPDPRPTIAQAAEAFGVSAHHLTKVVHHLGKSGLLLNTRGRGGGLALAVPASAINVGKVVRGTERTDAPVECFSEHNECVITPACRLKGVFDEALKAFYSVLDRYTLEDLIRNRKALQKLFYLRLAA